MGDSYDYVLPNHNGTPIAKEYIKQYSELVDAAYDGTIKIEDKINHKYIEMDPRSDKLCRGRYKDSIIIIMKGATICTFCTNSFCKFY